MTQLTNAIQQLADIRARQGHRQRTRHVGDMVPAVPVTAVTEMPVPAVLQPSRPEGPLGYREITITELRQREKLTTLDSLDTAHMNKEQAAAFSELLAGVRNWRKELDSMKLTQAQGRMFIVCSDGYGCGKTHIGRSLMTSYTSVVVSVALVDNIAEPYVVFEDGSTNYAIDRHGRLLTARDLWQRFDAGQSLEEIVGTHTRLLVLDDVGREPTAQYEKREEKIQEAVRQERYYAVLNYCYERAQTGRPVNVFLTSNMLFGKLRDFFNEATWSRIQEMAPRGNVRELIGFPDMRVVRSGREL